jgi:TonB family protein
MMITATKDSSALFSVEILANGKIGKTKTLYSSGDAQLDARALQGIRNSKYTPALDSEGHPINSTINESIDFKARGDAPPIDLGPPTSKKMEELSALWSRYMGFTLSQDEVIGFCESIKINMQSVRSALQKSRDEDGRHITRLEHALIQEMARIGYAEASNILLSKRQQVKRYVSEGVATQLSKISNAAIEASCNNYIALAEKGELNFEKADPQYYALLLKL